MGQRRLETLISQLSIKLTLLTISMFIAVGGKAQKQLSGLVVDTNGQPIISASVIVQSKDTAEHNVQITVTNADGKFFFHSVPFPYRLTIQHMAYVDSQMSDSSVNVRVVLKEKENILGEVFVKGNRPMVSTRDDGGIAFSGEQMRQHRPVETALEMIEALPMMEKNGEGFMLMGATETSILINGKKKMLSDEQLINYLKTIPVSEVRSLDVYYSTPSKFGVRGASVNIVMSAPKHEDLHFRGEGFVSVNHGNSMKMDGGTNFSLSSKKWSLNAGCTESNVSKLRHQTLEAVHTLDGVEHLVLQTTQTSSISKDKTAVMNLTVSPNDNVTMDVDYVYLHKSPRNTVDFNSRMNQQSFNGNTLSRYSSDAHNVRASLTYKDVEIGGEYEHFQEDANQIIEFNKNQTGNNDHNQLYNGLNVYLNGESVLFNRTIEYGVDGTMRSTTNYVGENKSSTLTLTQKEFETTAYLGVRFPLGKSGFFNTSIQGEFINSTYKREYGHKEKLWRDFDIYPTFTLMYKFTPLHIIQASLTSTKYYPSYWANASYSSYIDNYSRIEGNPQLSPSRKYALNVNYILKSKYIFGLFGESHQNYFTQLLKLQNDEIAAVYKYFNIHKSQRLGVMAIVPINWMRSFETKCTFMGFYMHQKGCIDDIPLNKTTFSGRTSISNTIHLFGNNMMAELGGWVQLPVIQGIYDVKAMWTINSKMSWKTPIRGLSVSIKAEDLFNTLKSRVRSNVTQKRFSFRSYGDSRNFSFTLRYVFNGYKAKEVKSVSNERLGF